MSLTKQQLESSIASPEAIEHHYDVGNDFYALWLDAETMSYTAAHYAEPNESLGSAQQTKLEGHAKAIHAKDAKRVLDIGCGWGGFLNHVNKTYGAEAVGLTLSPQQKTWVEEYHPEVSCRLESWVDHEPELPYDGIVSIEAFEAFARPSLNEAEKIGVYREFFKRCHQWLKPDGRLSLQMIPYGNALPEEFDPFIAQDIFPESNFPRLVEVAAAFEYLFEVVSIENNREDYIKTLQEWRRRLNENREEAVKLVGEETVKRYDRYFRISEYTFDKGNCGLFRLTLQKIKQPKKIDL